jgi:hypothetical protein
VLQRKEKPLAEEKTLNPTTPDATVVTLAKIGIADWEDELSNAAKTGTEVDLQWELTHPTPQLIGWSISL